MNRAILIVICDFIVSAMLSFYTASGPGVQSGSGQGASLDGRTARIILDELRNEQSRLEAARQALLDAQFELGFTDARGRELKKLTDELAEARSKVEFMEEKLRQTPESSGALSPEALQKKLEEEVRKRIALNLNHQDAMRALETLRREHTATAREYATLRENHAARQAELEAARNRLAEREQDLTASAGELAAARAELGQARENLAASREALSAREANLARSREELQKATKASTELQTRTRENEAALAFTRGRLSAVEKELAESRSSVERNQKTIAVRDLELAASNRKLQNVEAVLKNAVGDLSKTRAALAEAAKSAAKLPEAEKQAEVAKAELESLRAQLAAAEEKLRSDVLKRYSDAVVKVDFRMRETRLLMPQSTEGEYFLPLVRLAGRTCVIGDFLLLTGNIRDRQNYNGLTDLDFVVSPPDGGEKRRLPGPIYAPRSECRVALIEVADTEGRTPIEVLTLSQLKERGIQDLYLFKYSAFGKQSSSLEGRCSVDFSAGGEYLFIRNAARGTGSELRAEPGDFVLTKQGEFVAAVVAVENHDLGRRQEARCVVFPDDFNWGAVHTMPIAKTPGRNYLEGFARAAQPVIDTIRQREASR